MYFDTKVPKHN